MNEKETRKLEINGTPSDDQFAEITREALDDFWARVSKLLPQCPTGDLSPLMTIELERIAQKAIEEWWNNNCPDHI